MNYIILFILFSASNILSGYISYLAFIYLVVLILTNKMTNNLAIILYLIPCIRILDVSGFSNLLNILFLLVGIKYLAWERRKIDKMTLGCVICAGIYEALHLVLYLNGAFLFSELVSYFNIIFNLIIVLSVISDKHICLQANMSRYIKALMLGVFTSSIVYFMANGFGTITMMVRGALRLYAYGNDPNYFCMYILLGILGKQVLCENKFKDIMEIIVLFGLVFLTSSKMGLVCLGVYLMYVFVSGMYSSSNRKTLLKFGLFGMGILYFIREEIILLLQKIIDRFSYGNAELTLNTISSGRFSIVMDYLNVVIDEPINLLFGYGLEYNRLFGTLVAHNTYLDIFLSWGLIGFIFVCVGCVIFIVNDQMKFNKNKIILLLVFAFMLCSLSCLTSDMFWYLLIFLVGAFRVNQKKGMEIM